MEIIIKLRWGDGDGDGDGGGLINFTRITYLTKLTGSAHLHIHPFSPNSVQDRSIKTHSPVFFCGVCLQQKERKKKERKNESCESSVFLLIS